MNRIYLSFLILLLLLSPVLAFAQEEEKMQEYVDEHGAFTFSYPEEWTVKAAENGAVFIANSEEALEALQFGGGVVLEEEQFGIVLYFIPGDLLTMMAIDTTLLDDEKAKPEDIIQPVMSLFMPIQAEDAPEFAEGIFLEIDEETSIPALPFTAESQSIEGAILFYEIGDGIFTLGTIGAHTGELADYEEQTNAIFQSFEFTITSTELMDVYLNGGYSNRVEDEPIATEEPKK